MALGFALISGLGAGAAGATVATALAVGAAGAAIGGAYESSEAKKEEAKDQEKLDKENTRRYGLETAESIRRTERTNLEIEGQAKAQIGASGFAKGSSLDTYFSVIQEKNRSDVDWMRTSGASNIAIQGRESAARKRLSDNESRRTISSGIGKAFSSLSGAF